MRTNLFLDTKVSHHSAPRTRSRSEHLRIRMWAMTHLYVRHDSFTYATWVLLWHRRVAPQHPTTKFVSRGLGVFWCRPTAPRKRRCVFFWHQKVLHHSAPQTSSRREELADYEQATKAQDFTGYQHFQPLSPSQHAPSIRAAPTGTTSRTLKDAATHSATHFATHNAPHNATHTGTSARTLSAPSHTPAKSFKARSGSGSAAGRSDEQIAKATQSLAHEQIAKAAQSLANMEEVTCADCLWHDPLPVTCLITSDMTLANMEEVFCLYSIVHLMYTQWCLTIVIWTIEYR